MLTVQTLDTLSFQVLPVFRKSLGCCLRENASWSSSRVSKIQMPLWYIDLMSNQILQFLSEVSTLSTGLLVLLPRCSRSQAETGDSKQSDSQQARICLSTQTGAWQKQGELQKQGAWNKQTVPKAPCLLACLLLSAPAHCSALGYLASFGVPAVTQGGSQRSWRKNWRKKRGSGDASILQASLNNEKVETRHKHPPRRRKQGGSSKHSSRKRQWSDVVSSLQNPPGFLQKVKLD